MIASASASSSRSAATAMAGAVLRAQGSRTMSDQSSASRRNSSATMNRWSSLQITIGWAKGPPETRAAVSANMLSAPPSAKNCFGRSPRDSGHNRVPAPPERMTGTIGRGVGVALTVLGFSIAVMVDDLTAAAPWVQWHGDAPQPSSRENSLAN